MDSVGQPPTYQEATEVGLLQKRRSRIHMRDVIERYMTKHRENGLDGSIHPALNANTSAVQYNSEKLHWTPSGEVAIADESLVASATNTLDPDRYKWKSDTKAVNPDFKLLFRNVQNDELNFRTAIAAFERDVKPEFRVGIDLTASRSLDDIKSAVEKAQSAYEMKAEKGMLAPFRKALRKIGDHHKAYQGFVGLAPSQSTYFSVVCGGVMLLLEAAGRLRELNSQIIEALTDIPMLVDRSQRLLAAHPASDELQQRCSQLYVAVLHALNDMLQFYHERAVRKAIKVVFTQNSFKATLAERISFMQRCDDAISREADTCDTEIGVDTNRNVREATDIMKAAYEKQGKLIEENAELRAKVFAMASALDNIQGHFMAHPFLSEALNAEPSLQLQSRSISPDPATREAVSTKASSAINKKVAKELGYRSRVIVSDRKYNLEQIMSFVRADQNRAVYVMQSAKLQKWLNTNSSSIILVNGGMSGSHSHRTPISFVSAKLADALHQSRKSGLNSTIINLHFFCGEHEDWREDIDNGPIAVWANLIAQLLLQYDQFDLAAIKMISKLNKDDVKALGLAFGNLLKQLPLGCMVFCIVDNVSCYHDEDRGDDTEALLKKLVAMIRKSAKGGGCTFKLMLTSNTQLRLEAASFLRDKEVLQVPEILEHGDGFSDLKWEQGLGQQIDSM